MITRTEERRDTNWIAMIRLTDGTEIPCTVKDVSKSGARLGVPSKIPLPDQFKFKVLGRDFVCAVKIAWRRGEYVGVTIEQVAKLKPPPVTEPSEPHPASQHEAAKSLHGRRGRFSEF